MGTVAGIIPYQELLGNYDVDIDDDLTDIIPYQELLGNYDFGSHL